MARPTVETILARGLDYADMTGSEFPDSDRLLDYANAGLSELHDLIANNHGDDYLRKDTTFTLVSGTEAYALPEDFFKALGLFYLSSGRRFALARWQPNEIDGFRSSPLSTGSISMWYVPQYVPVKSDKAEIEVAIPAGWEDFVALHIATRLLMKEESPDLGPIMSERDRQRARIISMLAPRDVFEPDSIADVSGRYGSAQQYLEERRFLYRIMGNNIYFTETEYSGV